MADVKIVSESVTQPIEDVSRDPTGRPRRKQSCRVSVASEISISPLTSLKSRLTGVEVFAELDAESEGFYVSETECTNAARSA